MTLLSSLFTIAQPLLVALASYVAPDWFLGPDGCLRSLSHIRRTSLDTNHIDPINRILLMACGADMVAFCLMQTLASKDILAKRNLLRAKWIGAILALLVFGQTALTMKDESSMLNPKVVGFYVGLTLANVLWLTSDMIQYFRHNPDDIPRTAALPSDLAMVVLMAIYLAGWSVIKIFYPQALLDPLPFWNKTPVDDEVTLDEISILSSKIEGTYLMTFCLLALGALLTDRSSERIRWGNTFSIFTLASYAPVFVRAALDDSGYINAAGFVALNVFHVGIALLLLYSGPGLWIGKNPNSISNKQVVEGRKSQVPEPELVDEKKKVE